MVHTEVCAHPTAQEEREEYHVDATSRNDMHRESPFLGLNGDRQRVQRHLKTVAVL